MIEEIKHLLSAYRYVPMILSLVFVMKVVIFFKYKTPNWSLLHFFYFTKSHIRHSSRPDTEMAKQVENILSQVLVTVGLLIVFVAVFSKYGSA